MRAVVNVPVCPLYFQPDPDSALADQVLFGMRVETLETSGAFWRVRTAYGYEGWAPTDCLRTDGAPAWEQRPKVQVFSKNFAPVLSAPDFSARVLFTLPRGSLLAPAGEGRDGWTAAALPDGRRGYVRASCLAACPKTPPDLPEDVLRTRLVRAGLLYLGAPYLWGGKTPLGIDCSGLVSMAYLLNGVVIYRDAELRPGFDLVGIDRDSIRPGDVLFFPGHVALYLGKGRYLHATGRAGDDGVRVNSLDPAHPAYRADLARSLEHVGSYAGFHS